MEWLTGGAVLMRSWGDSTSSETLSNNARKHVVAWRKQSTRSMLGHIRSREKVPQSWDDEVVMNTSEAHVGHCAKHELHCDSKANYSLSLTHAPLTSSLKRSILPAPLNALSSHPMSIFSLLLLLGTLLLASQLWLLLQMIFPPAPIQLPF